jgi:hypothetical protein
MLVMMMSGDMNGVRNFQSRCIPACAGMTTQTGSAFNAFIPAHAGIQCLASLFTSE